MRIVPYWLPAILVIMSWQSSLLKWSDVYPWRIRLALLVGGVLLAVFQWQWRELPVQQVHLVPLGIMALVSALIYGMTFTLYRIFQRVFKRKVIHEGEAFAFDERQLVVWLGMYGLVAYGGTIFVIQYVSQAGWGYGVMAAVQGMALATGVRLSMFLKR